MVITNVLLLAFAPLSDAYSTFETSCTLPTTPVNFVSSSNSRGSLEIIWTSLFTIIACTWTALHLNIPEQREGHDPGLVGDIKWALNGSLTHVGWMLITVLAPEILVMKYIGDLESARIDLEEMKAFADALLRGVAVVQIL
ncbi:hypothetical protein EG329_007616 [Mollisiaceae sp. DMI_Dod_QoI]|nr:hypothetical protein EG329_007616 [Helotiales sp. DMI_Dod_QoI]